jgi:DNA mismatch endonuclease, patch repair protein
LDTVRSSERSALMSRIRAKDTKPEMVVRRMVHRMGFRFRLHQRSLPGAPDLVFPRLRRVIFVHGCFWHQHQGCRRMNVPKSRVSYWGPKLARNVARDVAAYADLNRIGWEVEVVWECQTERPGGLEERLFRFLSSKQ